MQNVGNIVATPRNGKVVEINSLWYNALMIMAELTKKMEKPKMIPETYLGLARKCKISFNGKFYNERRKCLYDVLGDDKVRPNQLFALSLTYPVVDTKSNVAYNILDAVEDKLLNKYGLRSLSNSEHEYVSVYEGDSFKRDMSYHQGITWVWLLGLYYNALRNVLKTENRSREKAFYGYKLSELEKSVRETFEEEFYKRGCIGSINEIYDSDIYHEPKGTIAQAWSVAEILRILLRD